LNSKKKIRAENRNSGQEDEARNETQAGGYERVLFKKETTNLKLFMSGYTQIWHSSQRQIVTGSCGG